MPRPEKPIREAGPDLTRLAQHLRDCRRTARLTYDELAERTGKSASTLKRAASGESIPERQTVIAFVLGCVDGDGQIPIMNGALYWWAEARIAERGKLHQMPRPVHPTLITTKGELSLALAHFYEATGAPSLRDLQLWAGGAHLLPLSTAARIVNRQALPASPQQLEAFLTACRVDKLNRHRMLKAWTLVTDPGRSRDDARKTAESARLSAVDRRLRN
ncbi:helix-turn-helix domain-containing protein [Streptomyces virginiae]|uniref:helix-turn-helix domain-containing protein n=1 Tax=Streptomyces TaxID=1883 RepID=UPI003656DB4E